MKLAITIAALLACVSAQAAEPGIQLYRKANGIAALQPQTGGASFEIQSSQGQAQCTLEGTARPIDAGRWAYTPDDKADQCVAVLNTRGGRLVVTTKGCESYCGLNAAGSMDGSYARAAK